MHHEKSEMKTKARSSIITNIYSIKTQVEENVGKIIRKAKKGNFVQLCLFF